MMGVYSRIGVVKSPSAAAYKAGQDEAAAFYAEISRCRHRQAEPVVLSTGETVACICIECLESLSADWVDHQRQQVEVEAYCKHDERIDISGFGELPGTRSICAACGVMPEQRQLKDADGRYLLSPPTAL